MSKNVIICCVENTTQDSLMRFIVFLINNIYALTPMRTQVDGIRTYYCISNKRSNKVIKVIDGIKL